MRVSVIVPARDERHTLPVLLASIEAQTRPPAEVIVADGRSEDGTRDWLEEAQATRDWLVVVDNPDQIISAALNRAVDAAQNPVVARMDAHAVYAPDYLERVVDVFERHPDVVAVGGAMATEGHGPWGRAIASVLSRRFGLGGAAHRVGGAGGPVDHAFSPAYWRDAVVAVGGFDQAMLANEDFELDRRLGEAGGVVWLEPDARCTWFTRESPGALARQMYRYGNFKARTIWLFPRSLRARQLAPPALMLALLAAWASRPRCGLLATAAYLAIACVTAARAAAGDGSSPVRAAVSCPVVHLSWGAGLLIGVVGHRGARRGRRLHRFARPAVGVEPRIRSRSGGLAGGPPTGH